MPNKMAALLFIVSCLLQCLKDTFLFRRFIVQAERLRTGGHYRFLQLIT